MYGGPALKSLIVLVRPALSFLPDRDPCTPDESSRSVAVLGCKLCDAGGARCRSGIASLVSARIKRKTEKTLDKLGISAEYILGSAKSVHDKAIEELNSKGFNSAVAAIAIKAQELLGRNQALWTDKVEHTHRLSLEKLVCGDGGEGAMD